MEITNLLHYATREELRRWLEERGLMTEASRRALATGQEMAEKNKLK